MAKSYTEFVRELIAKEEIGKPIYTSEISGRMAEAYGIPLKKAAGAAAVACKRIMDGKILPELRCYQKGIYYRTALTPFGELGIDREQLIEDKYLKNNNGYETGLIALHRIGLTTQMPNARVLATNKAGDCARMDKKLGVVVRPPKVRITAGNKQYLKILDVLEELDNAPVDAEPPYQLISEYVNKLGLDYEKLLALANNYYNRNTVLQLAHVAGERQ